MAKSSERIPIGRLLSDECCDFRSHKDYTQQINLPTSKNDFGKQAWLPAIKIGGQAGQARQEDGGQAGGMIAVIH